MSWVRLAECSNDVVKRRMMIPTLGLISLDGECTWPYVRSRIVKQGNRKIAGSPSGPASLSKRTTSQILNNALFTAVGITLGHQISHDRGLAEIDHLEWE